MLNKSNKQHNIGLLLMSATAIFWGAGFSLNQNLLKISFAQTPALVNSIRFFVAVLALTVVFGKKLQINKQNMLYGGIGGIMLFLGFLFQIISLKYTSPSRCGFFSACYIVFVPFIAWVALKQKPNLCVIIGVLLALGGLFVLNLTDNSNETLFGNAIALLGSVMFALQIVWADHSLKKVKLDSYNMAYWQLVSAFLCFVVYSLIFESKNYQQLDVQWGACWWRILIVSLGGTAFGYYSQTYAQNHLTAPETSLLMACESPIGAVISIIVGNELFNWNTVWGGLMILIALVFVEVLPVIISKRTVEKA